MNNRFKEIFIVVIVLIVQTVIYIVGGIEKSYIHMDEAYSLGLASYERKEIQENEDFYNNWHSKEYYEDYLSVNEDEVGDYSPVYENQKIDVHPPLYYLLLRFAMGFSVDHYSKWSGVIINIIIYTFITLFMYFILKKLLYKENKAKEKAIILAFVSSITMASLTNVLYIRMYALSTLNILITTFLHMKLLDSNKIDIKLLIFIGISALAGVLTHYYYLFFLVILYVIFAVNYIRHKQFKQLILYTMVLLYAGVLLLIIFPYSLNHMFIGDRGQGAISNLTNTTTFLMHILLYAQKLNFFGFNNLLILLLVIIIGLCVYNSKKNNDKFSFFKNKYEILVLLPSVFYFIIVSIASPYIELRYIMPVCGCIFVLVIYYLYKLLNSICKEKIANIIAGVLLVLIIIAPVIFKIEPESLYSDKKEIVEKLGNELNVPTIFFFNSQNNRFLDDILLFATLDESYIAKDMEYSEDSVREILDNKDTSNGVVIFINEGQSNDDIIETVKNAMNFSDSQYLKRLNACDVYYVK